MAAKQELEIIISPTGEVQLKVLGMAGKGCLEATREIEDALGEVIAREKTSEYFKEGEDTTVKISVDGEARP